MDIGQFNRLSVLSSDVVVVFLAVALFVSSQELDELIQVVPDGGVGVDELLVVVKQEDLLWEPLCIPEVEEDGTPAYEWLEVAFKACREVGLELQEELLFASSPFHKRSCDSGGWRCLFGSCRICIGIN